MGIKDNIEKQLQKENGMIGTDEIREQLCLAMSASWPDDSDEPRPEAVKAINDFDEMVKTFESLPVFEDTGERFVPEACDAWGYFYGGGAVPINGCALVGEMLFNGEEWSLWNDDSGTSVYKFYSTKAAAEAATKGGE